MREPGLAFGRGPGRSAGTAGRSERRQRVLAAGADALDGSPLRPGSLSLLLPHCGVLGRLEVLHFLGDRSAEGLARSCRRWTTVRGLDAAVIARRCRRGGGSG